MMAAPPKSHSCKQPPKYQLKKIKNKKNKKMRHNTELSSFPRAIAFNFWVGFLISMIVLFLGNSHKKEVDWSDFWIKLPFWGVKWSLSAYDLPGKLRSCLAEGDMYVISCLSSRAIKARQGAPPQLNNPTYNRINVPQRHIPKEVL